MKVLKNNYNNVKNNDNIKKVEPYPRKMICEQCKSELEYEKSDLKIGALGCIYLDCPCCGHDNMLEENEDSISLTADNVDFPTHFFHTSTNNGDVDCCNNENVKKYIRNAVDYFRKNKDEFAYTMETGNLYIAVYRYDGDKNYYVIVSNDYYSTYIPFESEDYQGRN